MKEKVKKDNNKEKEASIKHLGGKSWKEICGQATNYKRTKKSRDELIYILKNSVNEISALPILGRIG